MAPPSIQEYYQLGRGPTSISLGDGDTLFLASDFLVGDVDQQGMDLSTDDSSSIRYSTGDAPTNLDQVKTLFWGRLSADTLTRDLRMVPCINQANTGIIPLIEVHQPRVTYDAASNLLTMLFWTSFKDSWTLAHGYSPGEIYKQYDPSTGQWETSVPDNIHKVLCYCIGSVQKFWVAGGGINSSIPDGLDLVPLFQFPKVVDPGFWTDIPPYPGGSTSTPETVNYEKQGAAEVFVGSPLLPVLGTLGSNPISGNIILQSPADFSDSNGIDASPFFYTHVSFTGVQQGSQGAQGFQGPQTGIAAWPTGRFTSSISGASTVGQSVGVIHGNVEFVPGSAGARCVVGTTGAGGEITLVRDNGAILIRAMAGVQGGRQLVEVLGDDDTLSGIQINAFDPPLQGPQSGGIFATEGPQGPTGPQGSSSGPMGVQGFQGDSGFQGPQGDTGDIGNTGIQGPQGLGVQGIQGQQGYQGYQGIGGFQGAQGMNGFQGIQGPLGTQGPGGPQGTTGAQGTNGSNGVQGPQGDAGAQGPQGPQSSGTGAGGVPVKIVSDAGAGNITVDVYANGFAAGQQGPAGLAAIILNKTHPIAIPMEAFMTFVNGIQYVDEGILETWPAKAQSPTSYAVATGLFNADIYGDGLDVGSTIGTQSVYSVDKCPPNPGQELIVFRKFGSFGGEPKWFTVLGPQSAILHVGKIVADKHTIVDDGKSPPVDSGTLSDCFVMTNNRMCLDLRANGCQAYDGTNHAALSTFFRIITIGGTPFLALKTEQTAAGAHFSDGTLNGLFGFQWDGPPATGIWRPRATFFF